MIATSRGDACEGAVLSQATLHAATRMNKVIELDMLVLPLVRRKRIKKKIREMGVMGLRFPGQAEVPTPKA